jgi:hypothetical protein
MPTKSSRRTVFSFNDVPNRTAAATRRPSELGRGESSAGAMVCPFCASRNSSDAKLPAGVMSPEQWLDLNA